ncbi:EAL domain-containing protein [Thiotrichales bacterium 19X7-9]|nr:EAL domain-containing protein [Thiotrichales bacterium 19X7-9]
MTSLNKSKEYTAPAIPGNEQDRLRDLLSLGLLDTPKDEKFDNITKLVSIVLNTEISVISLVDKDRQWFKSTCNLNATETSREVSFCGHTILQNELFIVTDTLLDNRFQNNPLVIDEPYIRFYAGAVIHGPSGHPIGTLCIIDTKPKQLTTKEKYILNKFAKLVENELKSLNQIHTKATKLSKSLLKTHYTHPIFKLPNNRLLSKIYINETDGELKLDHTNIICLLLKVIIPLSLTKVDYLSCISDCYKNLEYWLKNKYSSKVTLGLKSDFELVIILNISKNQSHEDHANEIHNYFSKLLNNFFEDTLINLSSTSIPIKGSPQYSEIIEIMNFTLKSNNYANKHIFFNEEHLAQLQNENIIANKLNNALSNKKIYFELQPKIIISNNKSEIHGFEMLIRWKDKSEGQVSPLCLLRIAEKYDLLKKIDLYALNYCKKIINALSNKKMLSPFYISVNLSANNLKSASYISLLKKELLKLKLPRNIQIVLEVTESGYIDNLDQLMTLCTKNISLSIDDFGTGYSSLKYLNTPSYSEIKIDKCFVENITQCNRSKNLISFINSFAHQLNVRVVVEGVETLEQLQALKTLGCNIFQGYYFYKPMPLNDLISLLENSDKLINYPQLSNNFKTNIL